MSKRLIKCPKCKFRFDISYARIAACGGCNYSVFGECNYVKCPKCGYEFPKQETLKPHLNKFY